MHFYDHTLQDAAGNEVSMAQYRGKVVLLVNTATGCGFTPQYRDLVTLYEQYHARGLEIIDVPCNQFGGQAPGTIEDIQQFCALHFNTPFPQMAKADIIGAQAVPLYRYVTAQQPFVGFGKSAKGLAMAALLKWKPSGDGDEAAVKWNFTKFIVDRSGAVVARFEPTQAMSDVAKVIEQLL